MVVAFLGRTCDWVAASRTLARVRLYLERSRDGVVAARIARIAGAGALGFSHLEGSRDGFAAARIARIASAGALIFTHH